jgi:3-oxoadipate enol-lactonase
LGLLGPLRPLGPHSDADDVLNLADELASADGAGQLLLRRKVALEIAARQPARVTALALLCAGMPGHEPTPTLRAFWQREEELIEAGDIAGPSS